MLRCLHPRGTVVETARKYLRYWRMWAGKERRDHCMHEIALKLKSIYHKVSTLKVSCHF